jgi:hypothetical protein
MSQSSDAFTVANGSGASVRSGINADLQALATLSSGTSAPSSPYVHQVWVDTTNAQIKKRNNANSAWLLWAQLDETNGLIIPAYLRGHLSGLQLSNDGVAPNTKIDVTAGDCMDDTNAAMLHFASSGSIDCTTTGANALDTGSLANSTWYHAFAIAKAGGVSPALLASTSVSSPTFPSGYTLKRRLGSFKTDGSAAHIIAFVQDGDLFEWVTSVLDVNATNPGNSAVTQALSVPTGVNVTAFGQVAVTDTAAGLAVLLSDLSQTDETPDLSAKNSVLNQVADVQNSAPFSVRTNTSGQIRYHCIGSGAASGLEVRTRGWIDTRGRLN